MKKRLREVGALILTVTVTFISYAVALPAHAGSALTAGNIVALSNQDRAGAGTGALTYDAALSRAAQAKANDMAANGYFAHVDPQGRQPWYWMKKAGYYYTSAGENLAVNFSDADTLNSAWMNSPLHKANIMSSKYSRIGIGIAHGTYQGKPATFVVQFFAKPYATKVAVL